MTMMRMVDIPPQRWYAPYRSLNDLLMFARYIPREFQNKAAQRLYQMVAGYYDTLEEMNSLKPCDEEMMGYIRSSKAKVRWYDQIPGFHNAMNLMLQFPHHALARIDAQCETLLKELYEEVNPLIAKPAEIVFDPEKRNYGFKTIATSPNLELEESLIA